MVWNGSAYVGRTGIFGRLTRNGDGTFDLTQKDQTRYRFFAAGQLAWVEDRNGNRTTLAYDGGGKLTTVTAPDGRALTLSYSGGRLTQVTDPGGRYGAVHLRRRRQPGRPSPTCAARPPP